MADTKITALTALTAADPANDVLPIVDVSDTTMAASGTTKKISVNNILGASGTATLASATITGDLTVKTNVLKVDTTNNRVGIGTASPTVPLYVTGNNATATAIMQDETNGAKLRLLANSINFDLSNGGGGGGISVSGNNPIIFQTNGSEQMRLNSTGLGVGVSPNFKLDVAGAANSAPITLLRLNNTGTTGGGPGIAARLQFNAGATALGFVQGCNFASGSIGVQISGDGTNIHQTIDSSGNVGIGVTPSAGKGCLQLSSGINFPATQVASSDANTLDDYEEGTWIGTLKGSTSDPTTPVTATGKYTKIGRQVSIQVSFTSVNTTGASSRILITGLPFATSSSPVGITGSVLIDAMATFTGSPGVYLAESSTQIDLYSSVSNGAVASVTHNAGAAKSLWLNVTYTV